MYKAGKHKLLDTIIDGLQDKKGHNIVIVDLSSIEDTICTYFVIAQGGSPTQVHRTPPPTTAGARRKPTEW
mgnify:CR=1 FL=1